MAYLLFAIVWLIIVYLFNSILAKRFKAIAIKTVFLYVSTVALIGVFGEVFSDSLYNLIFDRLLWEYRLFPVHGGYTSMYSVVIWGIYGFYLYLLHEHLAQYNLSFWKLSAIISIEAIVLELLVNISYFFVFRDYFFYYLPSDLWHFTTIQAIPFYFLGGIVIIKTLKRFKSDPVFFALMNMMLIFVFIFLAA